ncbi:MAG: 16S rRNA (uracil(1498)-N(3))-methyltransferase [Bacteroidales bacterium]|nr:16S rRNA (uracil(1498)-N(3))-methyltransferase [Bacteroidales bacterium]
MNLFYLPEASIGIVGLAEDESKHCIRVMRMQAGAKMHFTNGRGDFFEGVLIDPNPKKTLVDITSTYKGKDIRPFRVHIAIGPTKNADRLEWFLEKAMEIGIDEISFFSSFHSERKTVNMDRILKVLVAAMKQSLKSRLPVINDVVRLPQLIKQNMPGQKFIAWIDPAVNQLLTHCIQPGADVTILIGPEGDFSNDEVQLATNNGFVPISLGNSRLRTETAGVVACHTIHLVNEIAAQ